MANKITGSFVKKFARTNTLLQFIVRTINSLIDEQVDDSAVALNTTHRTSDGKNHSDVVANTTGISNLKSGTTILSGRLKIDTEVGGGFGSNATWTEYSSGTMHQTVITLTNRVVTGVDNTGDSGAASTKIYILPRGNIMFLGATLDLDITKSSAGVSDTFDGDIGLGTAAQDGTTPLNGTEQNIIPTTAIPQAVGGAATAKATSTVTEFFILDATTTDGTLENIYLNMLIDDADQDIDATSCDITFNGTVTITWINLGDY
jgi:hypothetical protein